MVMKTMQPKNKRKKFEKKDPLCICGHIRSHHKFDVVVIDGFPVYKETMCRHINCDCKEFKEIEEPKMEEKENE